MLLVFALVLSFLVFVLDVLSILKNCGMKLKNLYFTYLKFSSLVLPQYDCVRLTSVLQDYRHSLMWKKTNFQYIARFHTCFGNTLLVFQRGNADV